MHAIKHINNAWFDFFHFLTAPNEDDHYDACKIGKTNQELQKDFLCCGSESSHSNSLRFLPLRPS